MDENKNVDFTERLKQAEDLISQGLYDPAISTYQQIIKEDNNHKSARMGLAKVYDLKARHDKIPAFITLAISNLSDLTRLYPDDEEVYKLLILLGTKYCKLNELVVVYKQRLTSQPDNEIIKKRLAQITTLSLLNININSQNNTFQPSKVIQIFFDYCVLTGGILFLGISFWQPKQIGSLELLRGLGFTMVLFYLIYKWTSYKFLNPEGLKKLQ